MQAKVLGFVCWSRAHLEARGKEHKATTFPDLTGNLVIFFGFDQYLLAKIKYKFKKVAWVKEAPAVLARLDIPIGDAIYMGCGNWVASPLFTQEAVNLEPIEVKKGAVLSLSVDNAKRLAKHMDENKLKVKHA